MPLCGLEDEGGGDVFCYSWVFQWQIVNFMWENSMGFIIFLHSICKYRLIIVCSDMEKGKGFKEFVHEAVMHLHCISELGYISAYFWSLLICIPVPLLLLLKLKHYISPHYISLLAAGLEYNLNLIIYRSLHDVCYSFFLLYVFRPFVIVL